MTGEPAASGTQAEPKDAPQAGTAGTGTGTSASSDSEQEQPQAGDLSALQEELKRVRNEAAGTRRKLREFEDAKKAADEASLSEVDKLRNKVKELEESAQASQAEARTLKVRSAVEREAYKRQFADTADAYSLIDHNALELDEQGNPTNVDKLLEALSKSKPYLLVPQASTPVTPGTLPVKLPDTPRATNGQARTEAMRDHEEAAAARYVKRQGW